MALQVVGPRPLEIISKWMNSMTGHFVPVWNPYMPKGAAPVKLPSSSSTAAAAVQQARGVPRKVVYVPSCVTRMMGPAGSDTETASVHEKLMSLFDKAGYEVGGQQRLLSRVHSAAGLHAPPGTHRHAAAARCGRQAAAGMRRSTGWSNRAIAGIRLRTAGCYACHTLRDGVSCMTARVFIHNTQKHEFTHPVTSCVSCCPLHDSSSPFLPLSRSPCQVVLPKDLASQCCGMMFNTRGLKDAAAAKGTALEAALLEASEGGKLPIVCDTSPCLAQIKAGISEPGLRFALYEPVEFIRHFLVDKLEFSKVGGPVCSRWILR